MADTDRVASADTTLARSALARRLYTVFGGVLLVVGVAGVVLPLLPGTPLLIAAAFCFARGHPELEAYVLAHPRYGRPVREFRESGVIPRAAKRLAILSILLSLSITLLTIESLTTRVFVALILVAVMSWIAMRPETASASAMPD